LSRFGSDPLAFFNSVYNDVPPWDIGAPQPAMSALLTKYPPTDPVLDVGCGSGDLSIYLAKSGHQVVGIDFVETAIKKAQEKVDLLSPEVASLLNFQVADASKPSILQQRFGAVVDSGFFHLFSADKCDQFIDELALTLLPNGRYYLHEFAVEFPVANMPRQISMDEVRARFTMDKGWLIQEIQPVEFLSRVASPVPAICACVERLPS
jgi:cyclopropane fatty-acyl-phospholipid synthase-like methyltransferase